MSLILQLKHQVTYLLHNVRVVHCVIRFNEPRDTAIAEDTKLCVKLDGLWFDAAP